jgi:hypothetical protein
MGTVRIGSYTVPLIVLLIYISPMLEDVLPKDLFDRVYTAANDPSFPPPDPGVLPTWNGETGEHIKDIPLLRMYRVSRRKFRTLCSEGIDVVVSSCNVDIPSSIAHHVCSMGKSSRTSLTTMAQTPSLQCLRTVPVLLDLCSWEQMERSPTFAGPFSAKKKPRSTKCRTAESTFTSNMETSKRLYLFGRNTPS